MSTSPSARRHALAALPAVAVALTLALAGCADDASDASASSGTSSSASEPSTAQSPESPESPESPGSSESEDPDTAGDGAAGAEASDLSGQVGQRVTFSAQIAERIGDHALSVTAPEAGTDPVLVYGALLTPDLVAGSSVDVTGTVEVFDRGAAVGRFGEDAVGEGTDRFDGTPAIQAGTASTFTP